MSRIMGALAVLGAILGAAAYFVIYADDDHRPEPQLITQLAGARLGMSPTDVTLALGKPSIAGKTEIDAGGHAHLIYVYNKERNADYSLDITFHGAGPASLRAAVICEKGGLSGLLGFDNKYSTEQDVLRQLGPPSYSSVRGDGLEKAISYTAWNASFKIALDKVVGVCIHRGGFIQYDNEVPASEQAGTNAQHS